MQAGTAIKSSFHLEAKKHKLPSFVEKIYQTVDVIPTSQLIRQMNLLGINVPVGCKYFMNYISPSFREDEIACRDYMFSKLFKYMSETTESKPGVYTTYFENLFDDHPNVRLPSQLVRVYKHTLHMLKPHELAAELENQHVDVDDIHHDRDSLENALLQSFSSGFVNTKYTPAFADAMILTNCGIDKVKIKTISDPFGEIDIILSIDDIDKGMKKEDIVAQISHSGYGSYIIGSEDSKHMSKVLMTLLQGGVVLDILEPLKSLLSTRVLTTYTGRGASYRYFDTYNINTMRSVVNA